MTKINTKLTQNTLKTSVSKPSISSRDRIFTPPKLPEYFQWRQETFDPIYHWALNDAAGSTTIVEYDGGPLGEILHGALEFGAESLIRPADPYSSVRSQGSSRIVVPDADVNFVQRTGVFTIAFWADWDSRGADFLISTAGAETDSEPGFFINATSTNNRLFFSTHDGTGSANFTFLRGDTNRTRFDLPGGVNHFVFVGDGNRIRGYINGGAIFSNGETDFVPLMVDSTLPLTFFGSANGANRPFYGRMQGILIDDRPWSRAEIKADFDRGSSATELEKFRIEREFEGVGTEFDEMGGDDLIVGFQFQYPRYGDENLIFTENSEQVLNLGDPVGRALSAHGSEMTGVQNSLGDRRSWDGEGIRGSDGSNQFLELGSTEDFAYLHQGGGRMVMEIFYDPDDANRYVLAYTRSSRTHTGIWWAFEQNHPRMSYSTTGGDATRYSANLGITEAGFYQLEIKVSSEEVTFLVDGVVISTHPGFAVLDGTNNDPSTWPMRIGGTAFGLPGFPHTIRSFFAYENEGEQ